MSKNAPANPIAEALKAAMPAIIAASGNDRSIADRYFRATMRLLADKPELTQCSPESIARCAKYAADVGLEPGPKNHIYFIRRGNVCCAQVSYLGKIELAYRTGNFKKITANVVYEADQFDFDGANDTVTLHKPSFAIERGRIVGAYAKAVLNDGTQIARWLHVESIERHRARAHEGGKRGPWETDYEAMAMKSVVHETFKWLSSTTLTGKAAAVLEGDENEVSFIGDGNDGAIPALPEPATSTSLRGALGVNDAAPAAVPVEA